MKQEKSPYGFDNSLAKAVRKRREREKGRRQAQPNERGPAWVDEATRDAYTWVTEHTETYNEHWVEEKRAAGEIPAVARESLLATVEVD